MFQIPNNVEVLFGDPHLFKSEGVLIFDDNICDIINKISKKLISFPDSKKYSDVITFAYWCRMQNLMMLKTKYQNNQIRIGKGSLFHIPPSNIPVNFAFSFIFGLLSGNSNIIRCPTKYNQQVNLIIEALRQVAVSDPFLKEKLLVIKYNKDNDLTSYFVKNANGIIIWGGDDTILKFKGMQSNVDTLDLFFPDKQSFCIINADRLSMDSDEKIREMASKFYNDTYFMDQNACSSPHIVFWVGEYVNVQKSKILFWKTLSQIVKLKYTLKPLMSIDKYEQLCNDAQDNKIKEYYNFDNYIYCVQLSKIDSEILRLKGKFGYFYEYNLNNIKDLFKIVTPFCQTLTYYGFEKIVLQKIVAESVPQGIDRIVPIGKALDMGVIWDGKDIITRLSRICYIE